MKLHDLVALIVRFEKIFVGENKDMTCVSELLVIIFLREFI